MPLLPVARSSEPPSPAKAFRIPNGGTVAGHKVQVISKDTTGPAPGVVKRLAQALVLRMEKTGGELYNVEFDKFDNFKDPGE